MTTQRDDIIRSFTDEQKKVYDNVLGDIDSIHQGWVMCKKFYDDAKRVVDQKTTGPEVRLYLINTVLSFWMGRLKGIEKLMNFAGHSDLVSEWKKEGKTKK